MMVLEGLTNADLVELIEGARAELRSRGLDAFGQLLGVQKEFDIKEGAEGTEKGVE
jgi:hypothetical protein